MSLTYTQSKLNMQSFPKIKKTKTKKNTKTTCPVRHQCIYTCRQDHRGANWDIRQNYLMTPIQLQKRFYILDYKMCKE